MSISIVFNIEVQVNNKSEAFIKDSPSLFFYNF